MWRVWRGYLVDRVVLDVRIVVLLVVVAGRVVALHLRQVLQLLRLHEGRRRVVLRVVGEELRDGCDGLVVGAVRRLLVCV